MKYMAAHQNTDDSTIMATTQDLNIKNYCRRCHFSVVYRQTSLKDKEKAEVFLDPNSMSVDGTTSISLLAWTEDGSTLAYGVNEKGSDWVTVRFRGANKEDIADVIERVKLSELAWLSDNSGIFYSTYPPLKV
ncbi:hypothetical protein ANCCEY_04041 [Ancylostoma ceylanicum]|uniref:Peptidase S9A N-terminal domain-containing protein n=1 Tax=Ancylostoma ceylanicum TaxID=53326 RepID=A0A0D6LXZ8_9BILA|nr:hypothetical protein ANCCEY_04041 [Ancylostoma ceylanicum]